MFMVEWVDCGGLGLGVLFGWAFLGFFVVGLEFCLGFGYTVGGCVG